MSVLDLIKDRGIDDHDYVTLSLPVHSPDCLPEYMDRVLKICHNHRTQAKISTNANGLNPIEVRFLWSLLWRHVCGEFGETWGDESEALLELCEEFGGGELLIEGDPVGYILDADGNVDEEYDLED